MKQRSGLWNMRFWPVFTYDQWGFRPVNTQQIQTPFSHRSFQPNLDVGDHPTLVKQHLPRIRLIRAHAFVGISVDSVWIGRSPPVLPDNDTLFTLLDARPLDQVAKFDPYSGAVRRFRRPHPGKKSVTVYMRSSFT